MQKLSKLLLVGASVVVIIVVVCVLCLIFLFTGTNTANAKQLIIDHDGGADDAMAIFMAALYEKNFGGPKLIAFTTTFGNVDEEQVFTNSQIILNVAGRRDVLLYRGATSPFIEGIVSDYFFGRDGLGDNGVQSFKPIKAQRDHAAMALLEMSRKHKDNLIISAIGPLTNIALAVKLDPEFLNRIGHLYVGGGYIRDGNYREAEFNVAMDPEAYAIVLKNAKPNKVTIIPFSTVKIYETLTLDWRHNVLGVLNSPIMQQQNKFERVSLANSTNWCLLDPAAMAVVLKEKDMVEESRDAVGHVGTCGSERGVTSFDFDSFSKTIVKVVSRVNKEAYQDFLLQLFSKKSKNRRQ